MAEGGVPWATSHAEEAPDIPEASYDTGAASRRDQLVEENLSKLAAGGEKAALASRQAAPGKKVSLQIDGMLKPEAMQQLLQVVRRHHTPVSFFISGMQAVEAPEVVQAIVDAGYEVGNYTLRAQKDLQDLSPEELVADFTVAGDVLGRITGSAPVRLKANASGYTDALLEAAGASGIREVVQSTSFLTYHSFKDPGEVQAYVEKRAYEDIISVKLSGVLDASEYEAKETVAGPATDKQPSASIQAEQEQEQEREPGPELTPEERTIQLVDWLLTAIETSNFSPEIVALRDANRGNRAQVVNHSSLYTAEPAVAYVFFGLGRQEELDCVLDALHQLGGVGNFFLNAKEIKEHPEQVDQLIQAGHSIGIVHYAASGEDYDSVASNLLEARTLLEARGVEARMVLQAWSALSDAFQEAASALGLEIYAPNLTMAREDNKDAQDPEKVIHRLIHGFRRGQVVGFRMNYFDREDLIGQTLLALEGVYNVYEIKEISKLYHSGWTFLYPLPKESILPEVKDRVHPGQLAGDLMAYAQGHYIGNPSINVGSKLPGFSRAEIRQLDTTGRLDFVQNTVFLTFDDWGTDVHVTKLLNVLHKHNVKATFFVRSQNVVSNPALLRAIALEGHEIASHTHNHLPLSDLKADGETYAELTPEELEALKKDIQDSYDTLQSIVGDIRLDNGRPALSTLFRPPTLAVSRSGMEAVFDMGISYIVNGDYTTHDYDAKNAEELLNKLRNNLRNGSVPVMHFSDNSVHTPDAVDQYLTMNANGQNPEQYSFARLSDYLGAGSAD
ncbi:MAG: polysaccharide deacetylase family protein [Candidatus Limiplasma sp.]|nr:polysaccharide deacetylase family protein [Candidatus Limiplasma sp.]